MVSLLNIHRSLTLSNYEATGPPDRTYKVVFAGDAAVGKTSFINRLTKGNLFFNYHKSCCSVFKIFYQVFLLKI